MNGFPADLMRLETPRKIETFMAQLCIALLGALVVKNLYVGLYALAGLILLLKLMLLADLAWQTRGRPIPIPIPAILSVLVLTILATIYYCGPQGALWAFPAIIGVNLVETRRAGIALALVLTCVTPLMVYALGAPDMALRLLLSLSVTAAYMWYSVGKTLELQNRLLSASTHDPLTDSFNRRYLDWIVTQMPSAQIGVLIIDIDHFKQINDRLGHAQGDLVLKAVAALIKDELRTGDSLYRIGGEEFVVLLPETQPEASQAVAHRIRHRIASAHILPDQSVTVSIGYALKSRLAAFEATLTAADAHLYRAKRAGRSRVMG